MKHLGASLGSGIQTLDHLPLGIGTRVATGCHHDAQCRLWIPACAHQTQVPVHSGQTQVKQVAVQPAKQRLGFGITQSAIELQHFDAAIGINHQAGVQKAQVVDAIGSKPREGTVDDLPADGGVNVSRDHRCGRVRPHPTGIRALVPVQRRLVIL